MHRFLVDLQIALEILSQLDVFRREFECLILNLIYLLDHFYEVAASHSEVLLILVVIFKSLKFCEGDRGQTIYREIFALLKMLSCLLVRDLLSMVTPLLLTPHFKRCIIVLLCFFFNIDIILHSRALE